MASADNPTTRLLIVDDDVKLCRLLADYLRPLGYAVSVAHTGSDGLRAALEEPFSAILLDLMLPGLNGLEFLQELRRHSQVPVLMLTARGEEPDRIVGLEMGADDYLPKTFSTRELLARLRAVLRRSTITARRQEPQREDPIAVGQLWIDPEARTAALADEPLVLTAVEFDLLLSLARSAGRVRTREQLLLDSADRELEAFDRAIDVHISSIRRKLGDDPKAPRFIETIRSVGYRMVKPTKATAGR